MSGRFRAMNGHCSTFPIKLTVFGAPFLSRILSGTFHDRVFIKHSPVLSSRQ